MLAQTQHIASDFRHYLALVLSSAVLQNVLDDIVAILVLNKTNHMAINSKREDTSWRVSSHIKRRAKFKRAGLRVALVEPT